MNLQQMLTDVVDQARRPGFWKAAIGQMAIAYGSSMVAAVAAETEERLQASHAELETLEKALNDGYTSLVELVEQGEIDAAVMARAAQLGWTPPGVDPEPGEGYDGPVPADNDPAGQAGHLPGDELPRRTPGANGAPAGQPDVPPRMAGGYLKAVGENVLHVRDVGGNIGFNGPHDPDCNTVHPDTEVCPPPSMVTADGRVDTD